MDSFEEILQKKHLKRTKARVMILKVLQKSLPMTARYEYTQGDHVHHAVCLSCNKIFPVEVRLEPEYKDRLAEENGFEVTEHRVEIYGFCKECKARGMDKEFKERMI